MPSVADHLRATAVLAVLFVMTVQATPGLDGMPTRELRTQADVDRWAQDYPRAGVLVVKAIADFNREVRQPLVRAFTPLERPLRIEQSWNLYGNGFGKVRRLEVLVDDRVVFRSGDADVAWRGAELGSRRIRPMVETVATKPRARNAHGLTRQIGLWAAEDFGVDEVTLRYTVAPWPTEPVPDGEVHPASVAGGGVRATHQLHARAPDWEPVVEDL